MEFKVLTLCDCLQVLTWRNETLNALRTPMMLTEEQQRDFYNTVVCNREAKARYWGIWVKAEREMVGTIIGMAGIENIEWENHRGEISLILDPQYRSMGNGDDAFKMLLMKAFHELNLENVWGVCYDCNPAVNFWERQINKYNAFNTMLPNMKYHDGQYWRGLYFDIGRT